jgi:hypothetical protein
VTHWFALDESRPLLAFAGIWRLWTGERKGESGEHQLFAFRTTESNDIVRPIPALQIDLCIGSNEASPRARCVGESFGRSYRGSRLQFHARQPRAICRANDTSNARSSLRRRNSSRREIPSDFRRCSDRAKQVSRSRDRRRISAVLLSAAEEAASRDATPLDGRPEPVAGRHQRRLAEGRPRNRRAQKCRGRE